MGSTIQVQEQGLVSEDPAVKDANYIELGIDFDDRAYPLLAPIDKYHANGRALTSVYPALQAEIGSECPPEKQKLVSNRSLPPTSDLVRGASARVAEKIKGPWMLQSKPLPNYGKNFPIEWGWRTKRPETRASNIPITMPIPTTGPKIEGGYASPTAAQIKASVEQSATQPYPTVPEGDEYTGVNGMGNLGDAASDLIAQASSLEAQATALQATSPSSAAALRAQAESLRQQASALSTTGGGIATTIGTIAKEIAGTVQAKYAAEAAKYASQMAPQIGIPYSGSVPTPPSTGPSIPWGTIAMVGGIGLAAFLILPKVMGR